MDSEKKILYHYCSVEAFFNIIKNACLWMSDIEKSNDYQECVICRDIVNKKIQEYFNDDDEMIKAWETWYDVGVQCSSSMRTFATCFSESKDQLSQWRGYAQNGKGIAIGFDKEILEKLNSISEYFAAFGKVIYSDLEEYVEDYIKDIIEDNICRFEYKGVGHIALELSQNYRMKFPFIKNAGFREEKEWRAVVCSDIRDHNFPCTDELGFSKIQYRTSTYTIMPYLEFSFEKVKQQIIKEIWIGPKSEVNIDDIVCLLNFFGYYDNCEDGYNSSRPININKSSISYC